MERRVAVLIVFAVGVSSLHAVDHTLDSVWEDWKSLHGKEYTQDSEGQRRMIWEENHRFIQQHNLEEAQGKHSYKLGMNQFGDLTDQEFRETMLGLDMSSVDVSSLPVWNGTVLHTPEQVDWRKQGYVTPVKDQGTCNSCWAFSSTGALEGQMFKKTRRLVSLSEQNLIDCSRCYGNRGCEGGLMDNAFRYIRDKGGIASESSYPYTAEDTMLCRYSESQRAASCKGYKILPEGENALRKALVYVGPISVSVNSSLHTFKFYESGIYFHRKCSKSPDHALLAVGYGKSIDEPDTSSRAKHPYKFWILKNSWGTRWGEGGYMRLARDRRNHCGIGIFSVYPEV
ncbi:hypothetical protein AGOR_G00211830 [Albula goreensis]|uniref:Cystein proteinase inhibitor protein salarin n=1 Tax=Albula goreensis TaxID=1534307 RepID=A0A8T3CUQ4_9TELE|nr:hypothetical protein AGOR_G00211830 [Albula goreensis]